MKTEKPITILNCEMGFAVPGENSIIIDCIRPGTGKSWHYGETLEQMRLRYPGAEIVNIDEHCKTKAARQDAPVVWEEITDEKYWYYLEVLPPACMISGCFLVGEPSDHHAVTGQARFQAVLRRGGKYLASSRPMQRAEFKALFLTVSAHAASMVNALNL